MGVCTRPFYWKVYKLFFFKEIDSFFVCYQAMEDPMLVSLLCVTWET